MRKLRPVGLMIWLVSALLTSLPVARGDIPAGNDVRTSSTFVDKEREFLNRTVLDVYRAHRDATQTDRPTHDSLEEFLKEWIEHSANGFGAQNNNILEYRGWQIAEDGWVDPMFCYCFGRLLRAQNNEVGSVKFLRMAHDHWAGSPYPVPYQCWAASHLALALRATKQAESASKIESEANDLLMSTITNGPYRIDEQNLLYRNIEWTVEKDSIENVQKIFDEIDGNASVDPWLQHMIGGKLEVRLAWKVRGSGWASTVTEAGWTGFKEHMQKACEHLTEAWTLNPQFPEPATEMIQVAMSGYAPAGETPRLWFDRAVAAQFDYAKAYSTFEFSLYPRWGGTHEQMYLFGRECLRTGRYDTYVPFQLLAAFESIYGDIGADFDVFKSPGVYEDLIELADGYINQEKDWNRHWYRSFKVAVAARFGKWKDARLFLDALESAPEKEAFTRLGLKRTMTLGEIHARTGETATATAEAEHLIETGQLEAAKQKYTALVEQNPGDGSRELFLAKRLADVKFSLAYDTGEWVRIPVDSNLLTWRVLRGNWTGDDKGQLIGHAQSNGLMIVLENKLGTRYQIRGNQAFESAPHPEASNFGVYFGRETGDIHNSFQVYQQELAVAVISDNKAVEKVSAKVNESNSFEVTRWDDKISGTLNGQSPLKNVPIESAGNPAGEVLALGGTRCYVDTTIRFEDLEVRKLTDDPAGKDESAKDISADDEKPAATQNADGTPHVE